jgi:AcrR family transcriptional regulator
VAAPVKRRPGQHHGDLRNALLSAALELVAERGPRGFSVAEAARRAGVSSAAPYKHFTDRDALLAALAVRGYAEQHRRFTRALAGAGPCPADRLVAVARAYVSFAAQERPLFDVVFGAGLDKAEHEDVARRAPR